MAKNKSRAIRVAAIVLVAVGAGFVMQSQQRFAATQPQGSTLGGVEPTAIQNLAAGAETQTAAMKPEPVAPASIVIAAAETTAAIAPAGVPAALSLPTFPNPPATVLPGRQIDPCAVTLDLMAEPNAMIGLTLLAPCHGNERVVLRHGGLAITGQTTATGALFTGIPAMMPASLVEIIFADGQRIKSAIDMPEAAETRRFAVQWQAEDAFQLHGFEDGAAYGGVGHVSGANPHRPAPGAPAKGGFLTLLGDSTTETPLLAEVYTFPADAGRQPEIVIEAAVTNTACGRDLLGETVSSIGGVIEIKDLTVTMPECDAVGDYLVLKNLASDLNIASAY